MSVAGLIFSNLHDKELPMLTAKRTMGAVPFGGRYRLIDFPLSAMVNAGIHHISVIAHHNYQSLMEHIGSGKDWDLARHTGGIRIVPPYSTAFANPEECYESRMSTLISIRGMLERMSETDVLCCDCDTVGAFDLDSLLEEHQKSDALMTVATTDAQDFGVESELHIWVAKREFLCARLREAEERRFGSFYKDLLQPMKEKGRISFYRFKNDCYRIQSIFDYYRLHMRLVSEDRAREQLFENTRHPIYTHIQNSPPTRYGKNAVVCESLIAEGCVIKGSVIHSVISRGVRIEEGCVVENAIVLENGRILEKSKIHSAILDKNVSIGSGACLHGHPDLPFLVEAGRRIG